MAKLDANLWVSLEKQACNIPAALFTFPLCYCISYVVQQTIVKMLDHQNVFFLSGLEKLATDVFFYTI